MGEEFKGGNGSDLESFHWTRELPEDKCFSESKMVSPLFERLGL